MNKLSIETLFPSCQYPNSHKPYNSHISVDTLYNNLMLNKNELINFDSNVLIKNNIENRKKIRNEYVLHYNTCCKNILAANEVGLKDIYYNLPDVVINCPGFNHDDCIKYISNNLRKHHLDTLPISRYKLFITWKYLELRKEDLNKLNNLNNKI